MAHGNCENTASNYVVPVGQGRNGRGDERTYSFDGVSETRFEGVYPPDQPFEILRARLLNSHGWYCFIIVWCQVT